METITKIVKGEPAKKAPTFLGMFWATILEYIGRLPVHARLRLFFRCFIVVGVALALVFWQSLFDLLIWATFWTHGFVLVLPMTAAAIHWREDIFEAFRMIWFDIVTAYSHMRGYETRLIYDVDPGDTEELTLAGHLGKDRQCKIECLQTNLGLPYQRARRILANMVTIKAMWIDKEHGNRRVLFDSVGDDELSVLLDDLKHPDDILIRVHDIALSPVGGTGSKHFEIRELEGAIKPPV